ncbi:MAG: uroporphyrinogen decarboxylase [Bdellovibrio sp. CG11_big_fil_rev_8_21_14_0_20_39_38]|nr:MAG: uroporphyrinogen decarboxylase [Bdellovibrio sp. CG22_combo_CG10-13_8_21_14_all_39_27]PIR36027.1 MAG: uroporphyrinogen decarboxylase [Bdellovibrio sp. CG11_big_fil_rev_8_21_14_0_20_39_38]
MGLFVRTRTASGQSNVPVWFMRQAGRYHSHYQEIKKNSDFMTMCKNPQLACDVTMGPIDCFHFDAAILFSDLLFPLEQMGLGLVYDPGPKLAKNIHTLDDVKNLKMLDSARNFYKFQGQAVDLLRKKLPEDKTLLGFVGAPFTLYAYAVEGGHSGSLISSKQGFYDGRWAAFTERLLPELFQEMLVQAESGADAICLFDTAAGELTYNDYKEYVLPVLRKITSQFKKSFPQKKIIYYSKFTHINYLQAIEDENIDVLGIDWRVSIKDALDTLGSDYMIQGNLDPAHLHLPWPLLEKKWEQLWSEVKLSKHSADRWIAGLGHGVLQQTPEENVFNSVKWVHEHCIY